MTNVRWFSPFISIPYGGRGGIRNNDEKPCAAGVLTGGDQEGFG
jgi:hypothetical protein